MTRAHQITTALSLVLFLSQCMEPVKRENRPLVAEISKKIDNIDSNHRVRIVEDDFHEGDSTYKIRAYYMADELIKIVNIMRTSEYERDDYFYFENNAPIFSGHMVNDRHGHTAAEYKYYYKEGVIFESLYWSDKYEPGKRFPDEHFQEFEPDLDSLMQMERVRLMFCLMNLKMQGTEIMHLNENLDANTSNVSR